MAVAPHLVAEAIRLGVIRPEDADRFLFDGPPDPFAGYSLAQRWEWCIRHAASGAPAFDTVTASVEDIRDGRRLPHPAATRKEHP